MTALSAERSGRRRPALRRLFYCVCGVAFLASGSVRLAEASGQGEPGTRILERQARITRDPAGRYRIIESLLVTVGDDAGSMRGGPLRLVRLSSVDEVRGLGGDVGPQQVAYDPPYLTIVDSIGPGEFQVVFTYVVTEGVRAIEMAAAVPLDELILEIQRGSVGHPDPHSGRMEREGRRRGRIDATGAQLPLGRPHHRFHRTPGRLAPASGGLLATAFAIAAMLWVWRRDAAARSAA